MTPSAYLIHNLELFTDSILEEDDESLVKIKTIANQFDFIIDKVMVFESDNEILLSDTDEDNFD